MSEAPKIIKNTSQAYGYKYASLADFVKAGVEIPRMTVKIIEGLQFVMIWDKDSKSWLQMAQVITDFQSKGMNVAQAYGSALTYARRYSVAMYYGIATDDDYKVERQSASEPAGVAKSPKVNWNGQTSHGSNSEPATDAQKRAIWAIVNANSGKEEADSYIKRIGANSGKLTKLTANQVIEALKQAEAKKQEQSKTDDKPIDEAKADEMTSPISAKDLEDIPF